MHVRVVRFTDVNAERMEALLSRIEEADGPPEGVPATGLQVLFDAEQEAAVVLQHFANEEDLRAGEVVFSAMDPPTHQGPGSRWTGVN